VTVLCLSCDLDTTQFPTLCTANDGHISGEAMVTAWNLDIAELYVDYLLLAAICIISRYAAYIALDIMSPYRNGQENGLVKPKK